MFMKTLQIDSARIHRALEKGKSGTLEDKRGKHTPPNATPDHKVAVVHAQIRSFPAYTSHYRRQDSPDTEYLDENLNISKMYQMYRDKIKSQYEQQNPEDSLGWENQYVSSVTFARIFRRDFKLKLKHPKKDTCRTYDSFKVKIDADKTISNPDERLLMNLQRYRDFHQRQVELAENTRKADITSAKTDSVHIVSFDLQKTFPLPKISTNVAYYRRQLTLYNLGVQNLASEQAYMYLWHEGIASRGAQEIGSCLKSTYLNILIL